MAFLNIEGYTDRFNGEHKTVFRDPELVYTVNPKEGAMRIIGDNEWYDRAALQGEVWSHNIDVLLEEELPLTFEDYRKDMMFCEVSDERIDGKLVTPAIVIDDYTEVEPYSNRDTFDDITDYEEDQIRNMQEKLDELIIDGEIAVAERECVKNDFRGPGCLRQFGRDNKGEVYLLEFGEYQPRLEGPVSGEEFLEKYGIEKDNYGVRSPVMLGDMSEYAWQTE